MDGLTFVACNLLIDAMTVTNLDQSINQQVQLPSGGLGCVLHGRSSHRCCSVSLGGQLRPSVPGVQYLRRYLTPDPQVFEH